MMELDRQATAPAESASYARVIEVLGRSEKQARPRKRKTLTQHIRSICQNKLEPGEVDGIVDTLFANKLVSETNDRLTYEF
jgi:hypothetical protein